MQKTLCENVIIDVFFYFFSELTIVAVVPDRVQYDVSIMIHDLAL